MLVTAIIAVAVLFVELLLLDAFGHHWPDRCGELPPPSLQSLIPVWIAALTGVLAARKIG